MPVSALCKGNEIPSELKVVRLVLEVGTLRVLEGRRDVSRSSTTKLRWSVSCDTSESGSSSACKCLTRSGSEESAKGLSESFSESLRFFRGESSCLRKSLSILELERMLKKLDKPRDLHAITISKLTVTPKSPFYVGSVTDIFL